MQPSARNSLQLFTKEFALAQQERQFHDALLDQRQKLKKKPTKNKINNSEGFSVSNPPNNPCFALPNPSPLLSAKLARAVVFSNMAWMFWQRQLKSSGLRLFCREARQKKKKCWNSGAGSISVFWLQGTDEGTERRSPLPRSIGGRSKGKRPGSPAFNWKCPHSLCWTYFVPWWVCIPGEDKLPLFRLCCFQGLVWSAYPVCFSHSVSGRGHLRTAHSKLQKKSFFALL